MLGRSICAWHKNPIEASHWSKIDDAPSAFLRHFLELRSEWLAKGVLKPTKEEEEGLQYLILHTPEQTEDVSLNHLLKFLRREIFKNSSIIWYPRIVDTPIKAAVDLHRFVDKCSNSFFGGNIGSYKRGFASPRFDWIHNLRNDLMLESTCYILAYVLSDWSGTDLVTFFLAATRNNDFPSFWSKEFSCFLANTGCATSYENHSAWHLEGV